MAQSASKFPEPIQPMQSWVAETQDASVEFGPVEPAAQLKLSAPQPQKKRKGPARAADTDLQKLPMESS
eukprot:11867947-Alexandrium_andersonii.AAC.1